MDEADNLCIGAGRECCSLEEFAQKIADSAARLPQIGKDPGANSCLA